MSDRLQNSQRKRGQLVLQSGDRVGPDNRYEVLFLSETTACFPYPLGYAGYIVKDLKDSKCKTLRVLSRDDSTEPPEVPQKIREILSQQAQSLVFIDSDTFMHEEYSCSIYELCGPNIRTRFEDWGIRPPPSWVRKVFRDILEALEAIHASRVIHMDLMDWAFVMTYPKLDASDIKQVERFYQPTREISVFNEWACATDNADFNIDFRVKLQSFRRATTEDAPEYDFSCMTCPTPEAYFEGQISHKQDIWELAIAMANIISRTSFYGTLICGRFSEFERRLFNAQRFLGPLPERYREDIFKKSKNWRNIGECYYDADLEPSLEAPKAESLLDTMIAIHLNPEDGEAKIAKDLADEEKTDFFSKESLELACDLLLKMMRYDPEERLSASQALQHPFFHQDLKYASIE